jgi:hypothetical protein
MSSITYLLRLENPAISLSYTSAIDYIVNLRSNDLDIADVECLPVVTSVAKEAVVRIIFKCKKEGTALITMCLSVAAGQWAVLDSPIELVFMKQCAAAHQAPLDKDTLHSVKFEDCAFSEIPFEDTELRFIKLHERCSSVAKEVKHNFPIWFAVPSLHEFRDVRDNLQSCSAKSRGFSELIPGRASTYIYTSESTYYKQYSDSFYGLTMRKGGWDCLR